MSPKQKMWHEIAVAYDTAPWARTDRQDLLTRCGLCRAVSLTDESLGYDEVYRALYEAGWCSLDRLHADYRTPAGDRVRAGLAALFAAMTDREREQAMGRAI